MLRGKYIALNACIEKNNKINKLSTNFTHNLSENRAGRNTGQLILRGQHNADAKIHSRHYNNMHNLLLVTCLEISYKHLCTKIVTVKIYVQPLGAI